MGHYKYIHIIIVIL